MKKTTKKSIIFDDTNKSIIKAIRLQRGFIVANITKVSQSGMSRRVSIYMVLKNNMRCINYNINQLLKYNLNDYGILIKGCGFDAIHDVLYRYLMKNGIPSQNALHNINYKRL